MAHENEVTYVSRIMPYERDSPLICLVERAPESGQQGSLRHQVKQLLIRHLWYRSVAISMKNRLPLSSKESDQVKSKSETIPNPHNIYHGQMMLFTRSWGRGAVGCRAHALANLCGNHIAA